MIEKKYIDPAVGEVLFRKDARSRRISIRVRPDKGVTVSVPWLMRYDDGLRFYMQKRDWVISVKDRQAQQTRRKEQQGFAVGKLSSGSTVSTLMSRIAFVREEESGSSEMKVSSVAVENVRETGRLFLDLSLPLYSKTVSYPGSLPEDGTAELSSVLTGALVDILRREAHILLPKKLSFFAGRYGFEFGRVAIKHNSSNWGSCSSKGNINLNLNIMRLPELLCDYVLLHELCHLRHPDHGQKFHALLERLCADNLARRQSLVDEFAKSHVSDGFMDSWTQELLKSISGSRSIFPVHNIMEKEIRKYRLM